MKRVSFALVLTLLVLSFGLANAFVWDVQFTNTYNEGSDYLNTGATVVTVSATDAEGQTFTGWSTPWLFTSTGSVALTGAGTHAVDAGFAGSWSMGTFENEESWDGALPDQWNFSGISLSPVTPAGLLFTFTFNIADPDPLDCQTIYGDFCIDSGDFADDSWDWLFAPPLAFGGAVCMEVKTQCNVPPVITNCPPGDISGQFSDQFSFDFDGFDDEGDPFNFVLVNGPGSIDAGTGVWTWAPTCGDVGSAQIEVAACGVVCGASCFVDLTILNTGPAIAGDCGTAVTRGTNASSAVGSFSATDANTGDVLTFSAEVLAPADDHSASIPVGGGDVTFNAGAGEGTYTVEVTVTDCDGATSSCTMEVTIVGVLPFDIVIEKVHGQLQGHHGYVTVKKMRGTNELHGFDMLIGYDASALTFIGAEQGAVLTALEWEYFTYRYSWNGNCGGGCPSGLLRVVGMGETNDGPHNPLGFDIPNGSTLFTLDFLVTNDRTFECMFAGVYFYWMDCGDNALAFFNPADAGAGIQTALSDNVYMYGGPYAMYGETYSEVSDAFFGFPTFFGAQDDCFDGTPFPNKPIPQAFVDFYGGGVDIICADEIDARGDVNLNGISNEIADAVVFTNYFIYGFSAFTISIDGQTAATEINGDGMVLSVADLVYLIRVIVGDALPLPKLVPAGNATFVGGNTTSEIGGAYFIIENASYVELGAGAQRMDLLVSDDMTKALVYSMDAGVSAFGEIIRTDGNLISVDAASYDGSAFKTVIVPADFTLGQNYPNPFNPNTSVSLSLPVASDYNLSIYNVAGQKVMEFTGFSEAGTINFDLNMEGVSSGIYFYKAVAGDFSATKKMVLLK